MNTVPIGFKSTDLTTPGITEQETGPSGQNGTLEVTRGDTPPLIESDPMLGGSTMAVVFALLAAGLVLAHRRRPTSVAVLVTRLALAGYLCTVIALTFFPFPLAEAIALRRSFATDAGPLSHANLVPFKTVRGTWPDSFVRQIGGNLVLLFPLGILAPAAISRLRPPAVLAAAVVGAAFAIEAAQLTLGLILGYSFRLFDIDDLWLNALGGLLGAFIWLRVAAVVVPRYRRTIMAPNS